MTYTINGKEYTEFNINKRCAELMKFTVSALQDIDDSSVKVHPCFNFCPSEIDFYNPCNDPADTNAIIEKCWDELMKLTETFDDGVADGLCTRWEYLMNYDNCTKLIAACICYIELNK
jgi:hypothetical protein